MEGAGGISVNCITNYTTYNSNYGTFTHYNTETNTNIYSEQYTKDIYTPSVSLGYQGGAGIMLFKRISIGVYYFGRMESKIKGELIIPSLEKDGKTIECPAPEKFTNGKLGANILSVRLGVHF